MKKIYSGPCSVCKGFDISFKCDHELRLLKKRKVLFKTPDEKLERVTVFPDITNSPKCSGENAFNHKSLGETLVFNDIRS